MNSTMDKFGKFEKQRSIYESKYGGIIDKQNELDIFSSNEKDRRWKFNDELKRLK